DVEDAERLFPWRDERDVLTGADGQGGGLPDGERDRQRPRQPAEQAHLVQDRSIIRLAHEALERAVGADREQLEVGHHPRVERDPLERADALACVAQRVATQHPVDQPPAMGRNFHVFRLLASGFYAWTPRVSWGGGTSINAF